MMRRLSALPALFLVLIAFSFLARTGAMMMKGIGEVAPTAVMLVFAVDRGKILTSR